MVNQCCTLSSRRPTTSWAALGGMLPAGGRRWFFIFTQDLCGHICVLCSVWAPQEKTWTHWGKSSKGPQRWLQDCRSFHMMTGRQSCDCLAWRRPRVGSYQHMLVEREWRRGSCTLFSSVQWQNKRQCAQTEKCEIDMNVRKKTFLCVQLWSSTGISCPGKSWNLHPWTYSKPHWTRSWATSSSWPLDHGLGSLKHPFQPSIILWNPEI